MRDYAASGIMVEYTSRCNLRCKYCSKAAPGDDLIPGRDEDMSPAVFQKLIDLINEYKTSWLLLAGTGESLFNKNWKVDFKRLYDLRERRGLRLIINSNFALAFNDSDFDLISQLDEIIISIDTDDRELTKRMRAKSDLALIIFNIVALASYCKLKKVPLPNIAINCTLYSEAIDRLPNLVGLLSTLPVSQLAVSDIIETTAVVANKINPVQGNSADASVYIGNIINRAKIAAEELGFNLLIQPHLMQRLGLDKSSSGLKQFVDSALARGGKHFYEMVLGVGSKKSTRLCMQPFSRFTLAANGDVFPCCVTTMDPLANVLVDPNPFNTNKVQLFRQSLLDGDMPEVCVGCSNAPMGSVEELKEMVKSIL